MDAKVVWKEIRGLERELRWGKRILASMLLVDLGLFIALAVKTGSLWFVLR